MGVAIAATLTCIVACVGFHLLVLRLLWHVGLPRAGPIGSLRMAAMVLGCTVAHFVEIAVFAFGLFATAALDGDTQIALEGYHREHLDLWYYSASFFTSLGADRPPSAGLRLFVACETVTGLILITWTASFLFLLMQEAWAPKDRHAALNGG